MSTSGEAAEQIVRISMEGVEQMLRIAGPGAEKVAKLLVSEMKKPKRSRGKTSLMALLKQKKSLQIFELDDTSLRKFCQEAKKYGVLYHVIKNKQSRDGKCEILVRADDLAQVNRIFERFQLGVNRKSTIQQSIERAKRADSDAPEHTVPQRSAEDRFLDELFKPVQPEKAENDNPSLATMANSHPSAPISKSKENTSTRGEASDRRLSVRKQLAFFRGQLKEEQAKSKTPTRSSKQKTNKKGSRNYDRTRRHF